MATAGASGDLVFYEETDVYPLDDLSGGPSDPTVTIAAKREDVTDMYRRAVWLEKWLEDWYRDTGKPQG